MKKLSLLVALALFITVSGVYAAWLYTGVTVQQIDRTVSADMADVQSSGFAGLFSTEVNTLALTIDQEAPLDYDAVLKYEGELAIAFTPNPGAPDSLTSSPSIGVLVSIVGTDLDLAKDPVSDTQIYNMKKTTPTPYTLIKDSGGVFRLTIPADELLGQYVELGGSFNLPTIERYNAFAANEEHALFKVVVEKAP